MKARRVPQQPEFRVRLVAGAPVDEQRQLEWLKDLLGKAQAWKREQGEKQKEKAA